MKNLYFSILLLFTTVAMYGQTANDLEVAGTIGGNGSTINVLKIPALDNAPTYFYINTNIPANDAYAPQIEIKGYMYAALNKAMKITISWYHYAGSFYWSQWNSEVGYARPSRIRLGTYQKNGLPYIRLEVANDGIYWSNYSISATDRAQSFSAYTGWSYAEGEMPAGSTNQVHTVTPFTDIILQGKVGIGANPLGDRLAVNGNIRAKEIKVETANWPDYVFDPDYQNISLPELEKYIKVHKHLPDMPSAKEVETNGISLGEMNKLLLKKIEELSLQLIELNKKVEQRSPKH